MQIVVVLEIRVRNFGRAGRDLAQRDGFAFHLVSFEKVDPAADVHPKDGEIAVSVTFGWSLVEKAPPKMPVVVGPKKPLERLRGFARMGAGFVDSSAARRQSKDSQSHENVGEKSARKSLETNP